MLYFVSGGSASGKSALAERICCALPGEHIYIATMPVRDAEDERKVARHHALRAGRGFAATLEMPGRLDAARAGSPCRGPGLAGPACPGASGAGSACHLPARSRAVFPCPRTGSARAGSAGAGSPGGAGSPPFPR